MTEDERKMLHDTHAMSQEMFLAIMREGDLGEPPLIKRIGSVVVLAERSNWAVKLFFRFLGGVGVLAGTVAIVKGTLLK